MPCPFELLFFILVPLALARSINLQGRVEPVQFDKYFTLVNHSDPVPSLSSRFHRLNPASSQTASTTQESYYIHRTTNQGVAVIRASPQTNFQAYYHLNPVEHPNESYWVFFDSHGAPDTCLVDDFPLSDIDLVSGVLYGSLGDYVGTRKGIACCGPSTASTLLPLDCNVWKVSLQQHDDDFFYAADTVDGRPLCVKQEKEPGKIDVLVYHFLEFKSGKAAFSDEAEFVMPLDPKMCLTSSSS